MVIEIDENIYYINLKENVFEPPRALHHEDTKVISFAGGTLWILPYQQNMVVIYYKYPFLSDTEGHYCEIDVCCSKNIITIYHPKEATEVELCYGQLIALLCCDCLSYARTGDPNIKNYCIDNRFDAINRTDEEVAELKSTLYEYIKHLV